MSNTRGVWGVRRAGNQHLTNNEKDAQHTEPTEAGSGVTRRSGPVGAILVLHHVWIGAAAVGEGALRRDFGVDVGGVGVFVSGLQLARGAYRQSGLVSMC